MNIIMILIAFIAVTLIELVVNLFFLRLVVYNSKKKVLYLYIGLVIEILAFLILLYRNYNDDESVIITISIIGVLWGVSTLFELLYKKRKYKDRVRLHKRLIENIFLVSSLEYLEEYSDKEIEILEEIFLKFKGKKTKNILYIGKDKERIKLLFFIKRKENTEQTDQIEDICREYGEIEFAGKKMGRKAVVCII